MIIIPCGQALLCLFTGIDYGISCDYYREVESHQTKHSDKWFNKNFSTFLDMDYTHFTENMVK